MRPSAPPLVPSITHVIGGTPMVELHQIKRRLGLEGRLLIKLEYLNPGGSKKDRIALEMIREARTEGRLQPGQTVIELTSGNTGTGLAIVCRALGHPFIAVMSRGNTPERARMMQALGAQVVLVDQAPGSVPNQVSGEDLARVEQCARRLTEEHQAFRADQFHLEANSHAHERFTGPEIWEQSGGSVDAFVDFAGSGGTFTGVARFLRSVKPSVRCYLVEPASTPALAGLPITDSKHQIQGGGYSMPELPLLQRELVTDFLTVTDDAAIQAARWLAEEEGIFAGFSAGAHLAAAIALVQGRERGCTLAFLACDTGLKYLTTSLYPDASS